MHYNPADFLLALRIYAHDLRNETTTFRSLISELYPTNGRLVERNLTLLIDIGTVYADPVKQNDGKYILEYHIAPVDYPFVEDLIRKLTPRFPDEVSAILKGCEKYV